MQLPESLIALVLLFIPPAISEPEWPHNLPKHMKYFPEEDGHMRRSLGIQERLHWEKPIGVVKMSADEGEMFFLDNWIFAGDVEHQHSRKRSESGVGEGSGNMSVQAFSPLRPHSEEKSIFDPLVRFAPRASLFMRDFKCPDGTNNCSSIGAPDSCCGVSDTCINIEDTGYGSVGCCPSGQTCAGTISCDESRGYSSCPGSSNGGCCLPGYSCQGVGCVIAGTSVATVLPSTSATPPASSSTAVVVVPTTPSPSSAAPTPAPSSTSSYTCPSNFFSCPVSLGGGCCQSGRQCTPGVTCPGTDDNSATSQAPSAPVRPTSNSPGSGGSQTTDTGVSLCPTGFYVCSAYYPSGCCRVGRDCQTSGTCIPTGSTVVVNSNGVTIAAPTGASFATTAPGQGGTCPSAWYSCPASVGGNCCPNGYACGNICTATASGLSGTADKLPPSTASTLSYTSILVLISGTFAIGSAMIVL